MHENKRLRLGDDSPLAVSLLPNHTTLTAEIKFPSRSAVRLTLKALPKDTNGSYNSQVCEIQNRIAQASDLLSRSMPKFYDYDCASHCVAMEFVPGATLLEHLRSNLSGRLQSDFDCDHILSQAAIVLAEFHRQSSADVGVPKANRSNESFVENLKSVLQEPTLRHALGTTAETAQSSIEKLPSEFLSRIGDRLLIPDSQPKNILIPSPDRVCFIDLDFSCGPPASNLALFVSQLDRMKTRYLSSQALSQIYRWKQTFLKSYFGAADSATTIEDFPFFYLWALIFTLRRHMQDSPWWRLYLSKRYARQIRSTIEAWKVGAQKPCLFV